MKNYCLFLLISFLFCSLNANVYQITQDSEWSEHPSWSYDGNEIAIESNRSGTRSIWKLSSDGLNQNLIQLTDDSFEDFQPNWHPNGDLIVFNSERSGSSSDLWSVNINTLELEQITTNPADDYFARYSNDGSKIAFVSNRDGNEDIWIIPSSGGEATQLTSGSSVDFGPCWSPNDETIVYFTDDQDIYTIPSSGGEPTLLIENGRYPVWSPDGEKIAYYANRVGNDDLWIYSLIDDESIRITTNTSSDFNLDWSKDGKSIVFTSTRTNNDEIWRVDLLFDKASSNVINTESLNSWSVSWIDYDNDNWEDIFEVNLGGVNPLYHNNGDGTFTKITDLIISEPEIDNNCYNSCATWGDYDNDHDLDVIIANFKEEGLQNDSRDSFFENDGFGNFSENTTSLIAQVEAASVCNSWIDFNNDGLLDLYVVNHGDFPDLINGHNNLFTNNDGVFSHLIEDEIYTNSHSSHSAVWSDYDNDNDLDLFVVNGENQRNDLFQNQGNGSFLKIENNAVTQEETISFGACWGDYNNDGYQDLFVTNADWQGISSQNFLYKNLRNGEFERVLVGEIISENIGSFGSSWVDYDNDGDLDIIVANTIMGDESKISLFSNNGDETFSKIIESPIANVFGNYESCSTCDYDQDGFVDIFLGTGGENYLYRNIGNNNNWINITCIGTESNTTAIGTKVRVKATINGTSTWQMREITSRTGKNCQNSFKAHFGLGDAILVDSLKIEWPSGIIDNYSNVTINQFFQAVENETLLDNDDHTSISSQILKKSSVYPNPFNFSQSNRISGTTFQFELLKSSAIKLQIFNLKGQLVKNFPEIDFSKGVNKIFWNGKDNNQKNVSTGIYFWKIKSGDFSETSKLLIIK